MAAAFYAEKANTDVPLWESRVDHSSTIRRVTGSELLAERHWMFKVYRKRRE